MASVRGIYADEYQKFHPEQWVNIYQVTYYGDRLVFYCEGQAGKIPEMLAMEELEEFFLEPITEDGEVMRLSEAIARCDRLEVKQLEAEA